MATPVHPYSEHIGSRGQKVKLSLKKFSGEPTNWITFWDAFESSICKNSEQSDVDRFNHLHSLLDDATADAISGLSLVNKHMDQLSALDPINSLHDCKGLQRLYDKIEVQVRSLKGLEVSSESYSSMFPQS